MTYYRGYNLVLIFLLSGAIQLHPLYAQEEGNNEEIQAEIRLLPEDIVDSFASTKNKADSTNTEASNADEEVEVGEADDAEIEIKESDVAAIIKKMEARKNRIKRAEPLDYKVINRFPHRPTAFTQGLIITGDVLTESAGGYGKSSLSKVNLMSGEVLSEEKMPPHVFAEGVTRLKDSLYQLTYRAGVLMVYDANTLRLKAHHQYSGEGWGLTTDGKRLIMSDGTDTLKYMSAKNFKEMRRISVTENGRPLKYLNELEWVNGKIYANVWLRNKIVIINPKSGVVHSYIDVKELLDEVRATAKTGVLNGIAYDAESKRLYVTGKNWPTLFEIEIES